MPDRLEQLQEKLKRFVEERDWKQFHNPTQLAMDISVEASELLELFQWKLEKELPQAMKDKKAR
jgi:NTP pyrophosphatase (non-canonical NTP hydrolase)